MRFFSITILFYLILFSAVIAQESAGGISYQAVALDESGKIIADESVSVRFSILEGSSQAEQSIYQETHSVQTDSYGLFSVVIGDGSFTQSSQLENLGDITWGSESLYLKVELDLSGDGQFRLMGTQQMMSVPFAMHAFGADSYGMHAG